MTDSDWKEILGLFEANEEQVSKMERCEPDPTVEYCRESQHRTLAHFAACHIAWLPLLNRIENGEAKGRLRWSPHQLFRNENYCLKAWDELMSEFNDGRSRWRSLLQQIDLDHEIEIAKRMWTAKSLTKRLVVHEKGHLDDLLVK